MNKTDARKISETITNKELQAMFDRAKKEIIDWAVISNINKGLDKGTAWNILANKFDIDAEYSSLSKRNMIWEFGDYLSDNLKPVKKSRNRKDVNVHHEAPIFND